MTRYTASDRGSSISTFMDWFPEANLSQQKHKTFSRIPTPNHSTTYRNESDLPIINRSLDVMTELNLKNIILEVDQAVHTKILDAMFRMELDGSMIFDNIIPRMGGFHI